MQTILNFLTDLKNNNNREWFADNKLRYEEAKNKFFDLTDFLILKIKEFDKSVDVNSAKECAFRIYKDVRFSKDKTPYKTNMGAYIAKGGKKSPFAGYYIHIEPNASFAGGGIYCPQPAVLKAVRTEIAEDATELYSILKNKSFHTVFPELYGDKVKTAPRGFDKNHPNIGLLRFKSYTVIHKFSDNDLTKPDFAEKIISTFKIQKPFNDYLNTCFSE
ncbi:MAG: DUF2461 domain-containing protein [Chlorobi bacterium]|nr:DUF2461 domain-containing protein [Chlorobiota bacterium]